jgi:hypothetical protein
LIVVVAVLTNPEQNRHKEVIKKKIITYLQESIKKDQTKPKDEWEEAGQALPAKAVGEWLDAEAGIYVIASEYNMLTITEQGIH